MKTCTVISIGTRYLLTILVLKFESQFYYLLMCLEYFCMYDIVDPDQTRSSVSDLGLHCCKGLSVTILGLLRYAG